MGRKAFTFTRPLFAAERLQRLHHVVEAFHDLVHALGFPLVLFRSGSQHERGLRLWFLVALLDRQEVPNTVLAVLRGEPDSLPFPGTR